MSFISIKKSSFIYLSNEMPVGHRLLNILANGTVESPGSVLSNPNRFIFLSSIVCNTRILTTSQGPLGL